MPDLAFLFKWVNFLVLVLLLFFALRRPVGEFFRTRSHSIRSLVDEVSKSHAQAVKDHRDIQERLKNIEKETQALLLSFRQDGEISRKKIIAHANEISLQMKEDTRKIAEAEVKKAREELRDLTARLVREAGEKLLTKELSEEDEERLGRDYLEKLKRIH